MIRSPSVICPLRIARPPTMIMITPMTPTMTVESADVADMPVIVFATLRSSLCAPLREDDLLALLGGVGLHDADAAERLREPAGDFRVDLAALAEDRAQVSERVAHDAAERGEHDDGDRASGVQLR